MGKSVAAISKGEDFQARLFWREAARLLYEPDRVAKVVYESKDVSGFDDVVVYYHPGALDTAGQPLGVECYQAKFHVSAAGAVTNANLIDPAFINAAARSLLQRVQETYYAQAQSNVPFRLIVFSPWSVDPNDVLAEAVDMKSGRIMWETLAAGTERSKWGRIRTSWRSHLRLSSDAELQEILAPLRFEFAPTLDRLFLDLNNQLARAGLKPVELGGSTHPYDDLIKKLHQEGRNSFTREELERECKKANLWDGGPRIVPPTRHVGIRTFARGAEDYEEEARDGLLCLLDHFNGRTIRDPNAWNASILPMVQQFLEHSVKSDQSYELLLSAHTSIAFAAGYCLNSKLGYDVVPIQSTPAGRQAWPIAHPPMSSAEDYWNPTDEVLLSGATGTDLAIGVSISQNVKEDAKTYLERTSPEACRRLLNFTLKCGTGNSVLAPSNAKAVADGLVQRIRECRQAEERQGLLHIFAAAPSGFMFRFGQVAAALGPCITYEYAFETGRLGAYTPGIRFPSVSNMSV